MFRRILSVIGALAMTVAVQAAPWSGSGSYNVGTGGDYTTLGDFFAAMTGYRHGSGVATVAANGTAVTGTGTNFLTEVGVGDTFYAASTGVRTVASVESDTALTLAAGTSPARTNSSYMIKSATAPAAVSGNVTVNIISDTTEPNNVPVIVDMGANILTIKPGVGVQPTVTFTRTVDNPGPSGNILFGIGLTSFDQMLASGLDNFVVDGSNNGTTSRDLTIYAAQNFAFATVLFVGGDSDGWTIKNTNVINDSPSGGGSVSPLNVRTRQVATALAGFAPAATYAPNNWTVQNNLLRVVRATQGAGVISDVSGTPAAGVVQNGFSVVDNDIEARLRGVLLNAGSQGDILRNRIDVYGALGFDTFGIFLLNARAPAAGTANYSQNQITVRNFGNFAGFGPLGINVTSAGGGLDRVYNIRNNAVKLYMDLSANTSLLHEVRGIRVSSFVTANIEHNTVYVPDSPFSTLPANAGVDYAGIQTPGAGNYAMTIRNNTVIMGEPGAAAITRTGLPTTAANFVSEDNILVAGDPAKLVRDVATELSLSGWQALGFDLNSRSDSPLANMSTVDLHYHTDPGAAFTTSPIAGVTVDVDNEARSAVAPYVGADEFSANVAPTGVTTLTPLSVSENATTNTIIGSLYGVDANKFDLGTISLTDDAGGRFSVLNVGGEHLLLVANQAGLNFEDGTTHNITAQFTDRGGLTSSQTFAVTVGNVNDAPENLALSSVLLAEGATSGTVAGTISSTDQDPGQTHTYTLVAGAGSTDNASFIISGNQLILQATAPANKVYSVRIQATDDGSPAASTVGVFTVTVDGPSVIGGNPVLGDWVPAASLGLRDDGTGGDVAAGDSIYSISANLADPPAEWKVLKLKSLGFAAGNELGRQADGGNMPSLNTTGTIVYNYDKRDLTAQNWLPATESLGNSALAGLTWVAVGAFQNEAGESGEWLPDSTITQMRDDGLADDAVAGDKIFTFAFTPSANLSAALAKIVSNTQPSWTGEVKFGPNGWSVDPGDSSNASITATTADKVVIEFDPARGHMRTTVNAGAHVDEWSLF